MASNINIFYDQMPEDGIFHSRRPGEQIEIAKHTKYALVVCRDSLDIIGIIEFSKNENSYPFRQHESDKRYAFFQEDGRVVAREFDTEMPEHAAVRHEEGSLEVMFKKAVAVG